MTKERKITLVTDEQGAELDGVPGPAGFADANDERMDALLRSAADEMNREIDFEGIRLRAIEAAQIKEAKRSRIRRALRTAMFTAASFALGIAVIAGVKGLNRKQGMVTANNTRNPGSNEVRTVTNVPADMLVSRVEAGTVDDNDEIASSVSELFPENLPTGMDTRVVDEGSVRTCAMGKDDSGTDVSYICSVEDSAPVELELGEAASVEDGDALTYYWQLADGQFLSIRFTGFEKNDADSMFYSLARRITDTAPVPETTEGAQD